MLYRQPKHDKQRYLPEIFEYAFTRLVYEIRIFISDRCFLYPGSYKTNQVNNHYPAIYLYKRIVLAKLFIDDHYSDDIDLNNIADEANFSKFHFIRLFKTIYGFTPHQYLIKVRVENAKDLLRQENSVSETCFSVGFASVSSFAGLFKKFTKLSPSEYQQEYIKRLARIRSKPLEFIPACFASQKGWTENSNFKDVV